MRDSYLYKIAQLLHAHDAINFVEIQDLNFIKVFNYDPAKYKILAKSLQNEGVNSLSKFSDDAKKSFEEVSLYRFSDKSGKKYLVTIYDSDELTQNPFILDVFTLN